MSTMDKVFYIHLTWMIYGKSSYLLEQFTADLMMDYIDMIYSVSQNLFIPIQPYYLMIDEAQDLNLVQHKMINNLIDQETLKVDSSRDRRQSIYGFSGSYASSFDLFKQKENVYELPLDVLL
jgi:hypothetical protein